MKTLNTEEQAKVQHVIESGIKVKQEVKDLSEGLRDTVKAVAEELEIKPALLTKAISVAFKESLEAEKQDIEELEELLSWESSSSFIEDNRRFLCHDSDPQDNYLSSNSLSLHRFGRQRQTYPRRESEVVGRKVPGPEITS